MTTEDPIFVVTSVPVDPPSREGIARSRAWDALVEKGPAAVAGSAKGWLDACGVITGLAVGALLLKSGTSVDAVGWWKVLLIVTAGLGLASLIAALWIAADAAFSVVHLDIAEFESQSMDQASIPPWRAKRRVSRMRDSRLLLVIGILLLATSQTIAWSSSPPQSIKVTLCADLSVEDGSTLVVESPAQLPESISLDDVSELTLKPCIP